MKIWGARGSLPSPLSPSALESHMKELVMEVIGRNLRTVAEVDRYFSELPRHRLGGYGGNTPCVELTSPRQHMIIDGGSGIRTLGYELMNGPCGRGAGEVHIFFTHFHWDHLIGLPFFTPIFIPGNRIHVYAVQPDLPDVFETLFKKPYFPVPLTQLGAKIEYHQLMPRKPLSLGDLKITPYQLDHPDPCWGYRIESGGRVYSHCVDTECTRVSREQMGEDLALYQGVDVMLFDAQYTLMETIEKVNWGHASASLGLDIAIREHIKKILFMHFDPAASSEKIAAAESQARQYYNSQVRQLSKDQPAAVDWSFAYEGMALDI